MNNAKTKLFQSGIIKCKAEGRFEYRCSEFKCQSAGFPGAELLDHLVCVDARVAVRM